MRRFALVLGIILVLVSGYSLLGGAFSLTREETVLDVGPLEATAETREDYGMPPLAAGIGLLLGIGIVAYGARGGS